MPQAHTIFVPKGSKLTIVADEHRQYNNSRYERSNNRDTII